MAQFVSSVALPFCLTDNGLAAAGELSPRPRCIQEALSSGGAASAQRFERGGHIRRRRSRARGCRSAGTHPLRAPQSPPRPCAQTRSFRRPSARAQQEGANNAYNRAQLGGATACSVCRHATGTVVLREQSARACDGPTCRSYDPLLLLTWSDADSWQARFLVRR